MVLLTAALASKYTKSGGSWCSECHTATTKGASSVTKCWSTFAQGHLSTGPFRSYQRPQWTPKRFANKTVPSKVRCCCFYNYYSVCEPESALRSERSQSVQRPRTVTATATQRRPVLKRERYQACAEYFPSIIP